MRLARNTLVVLGLVLGVTPVVLAQHRAGLMDAACNCNACAHGCQAQSCCPPLIPSITQGIHDMLGCLLCCPGLNARHDIYRAVLNRNDFGKCHKYVPVYSPRTCCCGRVSTTCPSCGPNGGMNGEEVEMMEMQGVPEGVPMEPTRAVEPETPPTPAEATSPQTRRVRTPQGHGPAVHRAAKPIPSPKTARTSTMRDRVVRAEVGDEVPQAIERTAAQPASLIQQTMLLQARNNQPRNNQAVANSLRK